MIWKKSHKKDWKTNENPNNIKEIRGKIFLQKRKKTCGFHGVKIVKLSNAPNRQTVSLQTLTRKPWNDKMIKTVNKDKDEILHTYVFTKDSIEIETGPQG